MRFTAPVVVGAELPGNEQALGAFAHFGVGAVEVGPVALSGVTYSLVRHPATATITLQQPAPIGLAELETPLARNEHPSVRIMVRLAHRPGATVAEAAAERVTLIRRLAPYSDIFTLEPPPAEWSQAEWQTHLTQIQAAAGSCERPVFVGIAADTPPAVLAQRLDTAHHVELAGVLVSGRITDADGFHVLGAPTHAPALQTVQAIRSRYGSAWPICAGGIEHPANALALLHAGADLVHLDAGLVYGGPGLPKRINEALRAQHEPPPAPDLSRTLPGWLTIGWLWFMLLGVGMAIGGILAWLIAATTVVLPYDLAFVGMNREQLAAINPRLLPYMAHNRITLAGTMIAIGLMYTQLAVHAVRFRVHWAHTAIAVSAATGFLSFFLFLGYGYFDPLHAYVSLLLLPLFLLGLRARAAAPPVVPLPDTRNDRIWQLAQWGQLGAVALGVGLIGAGITIAGVGVSDVFVREDLIYLCTTAEALAAANPQLVALVAHDRAGLGGALISNGLAVLLLSLWGIRRGARWVWWTLLLAGTPGFAAALGVHWAIGYIDWRHLTPGLLGLALFGVTLALLGPYLLNGKRGSA
jgi:dihydroorotate dehydrogenase